MIDTWYTPDNMNQACEHGHQRRKCPHCESIWQDNLIAELEQEQQQMYSDMMTMYEIWSGVKGTQPDWAAEFFNVTKANQRLRDALNEELPRLWDYYPNVARRLKKALEES